MGVFQSEKTFSCNPSLISNIVANIIKEFKSQGYECGIVSGDYGVQQVSIRKGGIFKTVLGLKTALNVTLTPLASKAITVKAAIGLFEQQALPTAIMLFVFWPVIITQIWGLVQQSQLDEQVMFIAEKTISNASHSSSFKTTENNDDAIPL